MNADQRRWIQLATVAPLLTALGGFHCLAADITPPSERQPAKGVAEYADELADAEQARKPLLNWTMAFTRFIASGEAYHFSNTGWPASKKYPRPVRMDDEDPSLAMKPTTVELLIERGFPLGNWNSHSLRFRVSPSDKPDISNHLAEEVFSFNWSMSR